MHTPSKRYTKMDLQNEDNMAQLTFSRTRAKLVKFSALRQART